MDSGSTSACLRWLFFVLRWLRLDRATKDAAVPGLNREETYERLLPLPPLSEQRGIADCLDRETAKIDDLVAIQHELMERLNEKRTAFINRTVTKGLDPDAPMQDSRIKWLGQIPAHWEVIRAQAALPIAVWRFSCRRGS